MMKLVQNRYLTWQYARTDTDAFAVIYPDYLSNPEPHGHRQARYPTRSRACTRLRYCVCAPRASRPLGYVTGIVDIIMFLLTQVQYACHAIRAACVNLKLRVSGVCFITLRETWKYCKRYSFIISKNVRAVCRAPSMANKLGPPQLFFLSSYGDIYVRVVFEEKLLRSRAYFKNVSRVVC